MEDTSSSPRRVPIASKEPESEFETGVHTSQLHRNCGRNINAPSATCSNEIPSSALRCACRNPRTCARTRSEMAKPTGSSAVRLMRSPEARFSIAIIMLHRKDAVHHIQLPLQQSRSSENKKERGSGVGISVIDAS